MSLSGIESNWVDLVIIIILLYYTSTALRSSFWNVLTGFISFTFSLVFALRFYPFLADAIKNNFSLTLSVASALGFLFTAVLVEAILGVVFLEMVKRLPAKLQKFKYSQAAALLPAFGEGVVLVAFIVTLSMGLPISPVIKDKIANSKVGGKILTQTSSLDARVADIFGGVIEESLTHLTIKPGSNETVSLQVDTVELTADPDTENAMLELVNEERRKHGVAPLTLREEVVPISRMHARDMWERKYFSHFSPDGLDVGDRLKSAGIDYFFAGENLALAPTLATAHQGLMNSEGHRANILEDEFTRVGIGVIDNGVYGKMFVQVFTN